MRPIFLSLFAFVICCCEGALAASDGPDAYGYTFRDATESGAPLNTWIDIESPENRVVDGGETAGGQFVQLGQPFTFYGESQTSAFVSVEGYISFNGRDGGLDDTPDATLPTQPSSGSGDRIYVMHRNWQTNGGVYYKYFKESPHDWSDCGVSVFSWNVYPQGSPGILRRFQVLLFDSGDILVQEGQILSNSFGDDETIGIQKGDLTSGLAYGSPTPIPNTSNDTAVLFELVGTELSAPDGAKIAFNQTPDGSVGSPSTVVIDQAITYVGTDNTATSNGSSRSGRVFNGAEVIIDGVNVTIFDAYFINSRGVAIRVINGGHLNLCNCSILGAAQHAIVVEEDSTLTMRRSVISNSVPGSGTYLTMGEDSEAFLYKCLISESREAAIEMTGGRRTLPSLELEKCSLIRNRDDAIKVSSSTVFIRQSTIADNLGAAISGGSSNLDISSATVTGNLSGGIILSSGNIRMDHSVFAGNVSAVTGELLNFSVSTLVSEGSNAADTTETFLNAPGDQNKSGAELTPPGGYGELVGAFGPRQSEALITQIPLHDSSLIDASASTATIDPTGTDALGRPRLQNGDNTGAAVLDIGAVEAGAFIEVTTTADENSSPPGGAVSLREALATASFGERIVFNSSLNGGTINLASSDGGQGEGLLVPSILIDASGLSNGLTISGGNELDQPLLRGAAQAHGLTLANGNYSAIRNIDGLTIVLSSCRILNNSQVSRASGSTWQLYGGGILNNGRAYITDCSFEGNTAFDPDLRGRGIGGGFAAFSTPGSGTIVRQPVSYLVRCQFTGNNATTIGGGIWCSGGRKVVVDSCVIEENVAERVGGMQISSIQGDLTYADITRTSIIRNRTLTRIGGALIGGVVSEPSDVLERISLSYCTIAENDASVGSIGGLELSGASVDMRNCTITGNGSESQPGLTLGLGALAMRNTILGENFLVETSTSLLSENLVVNGGGVFTSEGGNVTNASIPEFDNSEDVQLAPLLLGPLTAGGRIPPTRFPMFGSPAIDSGVGEAFAVDGRGFPGESGTQIDSGAVESGLAVVVTTLEDQADTPAGAVISLREALRDARQGSRVVFDPIQIPGGGVVDLSSAGGGQGVGLTTFRSLVVDATMLVDGGIMVKGPGGTERCLTLPDGEQTFSTHGLSFRDGNAPTNGAAIYKGTDTELEMTRGAVTASFSTNNAGAVHADGGRLVLQNMTLSGNGTTQGGMAVSGRNGAEVVLRHSTIFGNQVSTNNFPQGGAVFIESNASLECDHVAFGDNFNQVTLQVRNLHNFFLTGSVGDVSNTIADDSRIDGAATVPILNLGVLQDQGGLAPVCPPLFQSPVVNAGSSSFLGEPSTDSRGFARVYGNRIDVGAMEMGSFLPGTTSPPVDFDSDGIDDTWEEYYGVQLDAANSDDDDDGVTLVSEYLGGTNPNLSDASPSGVEPRVLSFTYVEATGAVNMTFLSSPGVSYQISHSTTLAPGSFTPIASAVGTAGNSQTTVQIASSVFGGGDIAFFRIAEQ